MTFSSDVSRASNVSNRLNLYNCIVEYIRSMIDRVPGLKVLLLDSETAGIISLVYSQSQILEKEVFLVERLDSSNREAVRHLKAICFIRPTPQNIQKISQELKQPLYSEYHLFFSNIVPHSELERIARFDEFELVEEIHEFFADVFVFNYNLFSLNIPSVAGLYSDSSVWKALDETIFKRLLDGLFSILIAIRAKPTIRYQKNSGPCSRLAWQLLTKINEENSLFEGAAGYGNPNSKNDSGTSSRSTKGTVLLIVDRRDDPVTPLLNQWTYEAMLHEMVGIENNRVDMKNVPGTKENLGQIVMSPFLDSFYEESHLANFGQLGYSIKQYVEAYQQQTKNTAKIESIEDMQNFVEIYPEYQKMSGNVSKHVTTLHELSRLVEENNLLDVSSLEQDIVCRENMQEHFKYTMEKIQGDDIPKFEQTRLALLYALRYEGDATVKQIQRKLLDNGIDKAQVDLLDAIIEYGGTECRSGDLFQNKNFFSIAKNSVQRSFKGTSNVFTQHRSALFSTLEYLIKGKLKEATYPMLGGDSAASGTKEKPNNIVVFMVGGATYEEARDVAALNSQGGPQIILGGSTIHNSRSFLTDVSQLVKRQAA